MQLVPKYDTVFVISWSNAVTGGPECLHQLVHILHRLGANAFASYWPFNSATPAPYRIYEIANAKPLDSRR